jgi:hypothetical protein
MPSRVLFLTPAIRAVSSAMQWNTLRLGGSGARTAAAAAAASAFAVRGGKVLRRILGRVRVVVKVDSECECERSVDEGVLGARFVAAMFVS